MKKSKFLTLVLLGFFISSCTTLSYIGDPRIKYQNISIPEKGQIVTANLGMNMITQGKSSVAVGVRINKEQLNGFVKVGDYMPTQENNEKIVFENYSNGNHITGNTFGITDYILVYYKNTNELKYEMYGGSMKVKNFSDTVTNFELRDVYSVSADNFQQTLIYLGKSGQTIKLAYREFNGDFIKPAFSTEVSYDLSETKKIGYMNCEMEILEATNSYIKYKVIKNFND